MQESLQTNLNLRSSIKMNNELLIAAEVLEKEASAIKELAKTLNENFIKLMDIIYFIKGRLVITGIGKPGHVGRKLAATFSSTGTPAFFVHPAEASHGDLGMITPDDCVLVLSYSGETLELADIVKYTRRFGLKLISITGDSKSSLAESSDATIILPHITEACPHRLAPTTSTTMMLAVGDALAICLLHRRQFKAEDFKLLHPGGQLGKKLLKVEDLMHTGEAIPLVPETQLMSEVILLITAKSFGCAAVINANGEMVGIITDGDLRRHMSLELLSKSAKEIMTKSPITVSKNTTVLETINIMNSKKITNLFVLENNKPIGILHIHDCLRAGVA